MKQIKTYILLGFTIVTFSSCATVLGGRITSCQFNRPKAGDAPRQIRAAALVGDILLFPIGIAIDFATRAIYVPCDAEKRADRKKRMRKIDPVYGNYE